MLDLLFVMDFVRTNQYCETKEEKDLCKSALTGCYECRGNKVYNDDDVLRVLL